MKKRITNFVIPALVAFASLALLTSSAKAFNYANGDLLLGFHSTGAEANDFVIDLGPATQFDGKSAGYTLSLGNISTDLQTLLGAGWASNSLLYWGAIGGNSSSNILWSSKAESTLGTITSAWKNKSSLTQSGVTSSVDSVGTNLLGYGTVGSFTNSAFEAKGSANSWASWQPGYGATDGANSNGISFGYFNPTNEANSASGISTTALDLFRMNPGSGNGTYEGTFTVSSNGDLSFAVVPEPSTYAALGVGAVMIAAAVRRQRKSATL